MEVLISMIPDSVRRLISESSSVDDLLFTCSSLLNFFRNLPFFHQLVSDLTNLDTALCRKNKEAAMETKAKGNECFGRGEYSAALRFYSQALRTAPNDAQDKENNLVSTLYLNRSSTLHKLGLLQESLRDCNRALMVSPTYAKAWYRRAKINSSLGNSEEAIRDFSVSLNVEKSLAGRRQIESELNLLTKQPVIRSNDINMPNENSSDENIQVELQCVSREARGRGLVASTDICPASLVHKEAPYAAIISKPCRETHCAYCFNELPVDTVPCLSCSAPLYCSEKCRFQAGGEEVPKFKDDFGSLQQLPSELVQHIRNVTSSSKSSSDSEQFHEHRHECRGMNWSSVLPSPLVLAGRILIRHIEKQTPKFDGNLDLCQNYGGEPAERKLDFHFFSVILLYCLHQFNPSRLPLDSAIASQIVVILSQIAVNSFLIVRQKYGDETEPLSSNATSPIEQVEVAQAIYSRGSLYNHSCQPNVHAYFFSRTLFIRATENITAGSELELSYGPQAGQSSFSDRQKFLAYIYSFRCKCSGCSELILSDFVHGSYRCKVPNCNGVILDYGIAECVKEKFQLISSQRGHDACLKMMHQLSDVRIRRLGRLFTENNSTSPEKSSLFGKCLGCGSSCDLRAPQKAIDKADINVERLQESVSRGEIPSKDAITDAVKSLKRLRKVLHPLNYKIAEVENVLAKAFCLIGDMQAAYRHCKASFEILEALHGENHIIVGNELIKLSSFQDFVGLAAAAAESISRLRAIFSRHYGSHANLVLPHLPQ